MTEVDLASQATDPPAAGGDDGGPVMQRVVEFVDAAGRAAGTPCSDSPGRHVERLMRPFVVEAVNEEIEARLLLYDVGRRGPGRLRFERQMYALMPTGAMRSTRMAEPQPPRRESAQPIQGMRGREGYSVVGPNGWGSPHRALKDPEGISFLRCRQGFAGEQVALAKTVMVSG